MPSSSATRNKTNIPMAAPDASDAGGVTTSWTSVLLSVSVMGAPGVALNSSAENWI